MSLPVIVRDEAEADIAEAAIWYERRGVGLGAEFVRSIDACLSLISRQPEIFPVVYRQEFGARELERTFERLVSQPLAEAILAGKIQSGSVVANMQQGIVIFRVAG